jgi:hypothetical protein
MFEQDQEPNDLGGCCALYFLVGLAVFIGVLGYFLFR